jgi:NADPH-dependent curcumin reductase CurA
MRIQILGFNVADYVRKAAEVSEILLTAWKEGKITLNDEIETVFESTLEDIPHTWLRIFKGDNRGKMLTKVI